VAKKKGEKREREKRSDFFSASFLRPLLGAPNPGAGNGLDFLRLRIFYHQSGLSQLLMAQEENYLKYSRVREKRLLSLT